MPEIGPRILVANPQKLANGGPFCEIRDVSL
jgi:hypothetical protein